MRESMVTNHSLSLEWQVLTLGRRLHSWEDEVGQGRGHHPRRYYTRNHSTEPGKISKEDNDEDETKGSQAQESITLEKDTYTNPTILLLIHS